VQALFISIFQNPFDLDTIPNELINVSTGQYLSPEVTKVLAAFKERNQQRIEQLVSGTQTGE
jgi:hypothetical protein